MKLHELYTINHLPLKAPVRPSTDNGVNWHYRALQGFAQELQQKGFTPLGQGANGMLFTNSSLGYAIKIFRKDDVGYKGFLELVLHDRGNPYFPSIRGRFKRINDEFYACRTEILDPVPVPMYQTLNKFQDIADGTTSLGVNSFIRKMNATITPALKSVITDDFLNTLFDVCQYGEIHDLGLDLHDGNFMMRGNTLVITDPF